MKTTTPGAKFFHKFTCETVEVVAADETAVRLTGSTKVVPTWVFLDLIRMGHYVPVAG